MPFTRNDDEVTFSEAQEAANDAAPFPVVLDDSGPVPGDPDCPFCRGEGDCVECDPDTDWK